MVRSHFFIEKKVTFSYYSCNERRRKGRRASPFDIILNQVFLEIINALKRKASGDDV
jgi:hypothetical protein